MGCSMLYPVSRSRVSDLGWICLALAAAAIAVSGCAGPQHRPKTVTLTDGKDTVTIRKTADGTVIEAKESDTGERAVVTSRTDGTVTIEATADGEEAVIEVGPDRTVARPQSQ